MANGSAHHRLFVWDLPTRLFHWTLVGLVAIAWLTAEGEGFVFVLHEFAGYGILLLIGFRLIWGFVGSEHSRFRAFVRPWPAVRGHLLGLARLRPPRTIGHNPLGGWMVVALLAVLVAQLATGAFAGEEEAAGPLAALVSPGAAELWAEVHEGLAVLLLSMIGVHVAGVFVDSLLTGENLVRAMWTGYKETTPAGPGAARGAPPAPAWRAMVVLAAVAGVTWLAAAL